MKKNFLIIILLSSNCILKPMASKAETERPLAYKIIEGRRLASETVQGKETDAKLMDTRNKIERDLKKAKYDIDKEMQDLSAKARTVDTEILEREARKLEQKNKELQLKAESEQAAYESLLKKEIGKFNNDIKQTVVETAKQKNWDVVQIKETGEILYTSDRIDPTSEIVKAHDIRFKAAKKPATVTQAAAKPVAH